MSITRRSFLLGASSIISASFVSQATRHILETGKPLLSQSHNFQRTLYVYTESGWSEESRLINLGSMLFEPLEGITWREYLRAQGYQIQTQQQLDQALGELDIEERDLERQVTDFADRWEDGLNPGAQAMQFLGNVDLGPDLSLNGDTGGTAGAINFEYNIAGSEWVEADDDLSVFLLQARLAELGIPVEIKIDVDEW
jgi:hypothetical protein